MILTDKTKEDFLKWLENKDVAPYTSMFFDVPQIVQHSFIIEWFDSVGIYINHDVISNENLLILDNWYFVIKINEEDVDFITNDYYYNTRTEAITEAIKRANVIYNNK